MQKLRPLQQILKNYNKTLTQRHYFSSLKDNKLNSENLNNNYTQNEYSDIEIENKVNWTRDREINDSIKYQKRKKEAAHEWKIAFFLTVLYVGTFYGREEQLFWWKMHEITTFTPTPHKTGL